MSSPLRLTDIASQARVSEATVSRVLNGKAGVAAGTRHRVLAAMDLLGYERPVRLKRRSNGLVGLLIPELTNPIFPAFAQVIEQALAGHGYTPVLCTQTPGGATEDELVEQLEERGVTGIVFLSGLHADATADPARYQRLAARGVPFVMVNGFNEHVQAPFVSPDDRAAAEMAVRHLEELGHRRIGLAIGPTRYVPSARKEQGFLTARPGADGEGLVQRTLFTVEGGHAAGIALLERGCTGVVCASDMMALGVIRAARERGLRVPEDVSVVGFDDSPLIRAMATAAVGALLEAVAGTPVQRTEYVFQPELVVRGSTGPG
ncbi:LacI family DNA-binding transcriptional regulator [Streptomyces katrae]|uniref:LacI family DNA-binding transcriptional regulator n=1 Tax=Streptomyces katrae TaxID=68223 RepID=UPI000A9EE8B3|nr:LacI family DNA-binding transcriptional regulator [Streptomyces katrae]